MGTNMRFNIDFFPGYNGKKINVIFSDTTGIKINI